MDERSSDSCKERVKLSASGFIQAGGRSLRMGTNKALVDFGGAPLIARPISLLRQTTVRQAIITSEPELYSELGLECLPDYQPGLGPLSGICSALIHSSTELVVVLACDMPFLRAELIEYLLDRAAGADAVVPYDEKGYLQPLAAVYKKSCLQPALRLIEERKLSPKALLESVETVRIAFKELRKLNGHQLFFANANTPEELDYCKRQLNRS